jgi:Family of unknown function (DUF6518)
MKSAVRGPVGAQARALVASARELGPRRVLTVSARRTAGSVLLGALTGAAMGVATALAQPHVYLPWSVLVNSSSPWLLAAFVAGALRRRPWPAAVAGLATCLVEVGAYFLTWSARHVLVPNAYGSFWTLCAIVGGPAAGLAGWGWRRGRERVHALGAAFLPGTFIAEAFGAYGLRLHYEPAVAMFLAIGVVLFALMAWPGTGFGLITEPASGRVILAWTALFTVAGMLIYGPLLNAVVGVTSGGVWPLPAAG